MQEIRPGVWKLTLGTPEEVTPVALQHRLPAAAGSMPPAPPCAFAPGSITGRATARGFMVKLPLQGGEQLYGLGLQLLSFNQRGLKKTLRVNSDPRADLGDSHAPVPFYVSTAGYGVLVDTARYATFYMGSAKPHVDRRVAGPSAAVPLTALSGEELYRQHADPTGEVVVEVPVARGVDIYIFAGPTLLEAVQRYNMFSGGGCLPPRWGLGFWYRCRGDFTQAQTEAMAADLRNAEIPCDVLGLEPGWQTHSYACTYVWSDKFPDPAALLSRLRAQGFRVNLWEHAFIDAGSPIYEAMLPYAGDHDVWNGLVPDLTLPEARRVFADWQERAHIALGASGYKLDECDNSDFISYPWSYPEISRFPSGLDGEQMHSLMGMQYMETIDAIFRRRGERTYGEVRSAHALAAPYPFVLYSDLYGHKDFIRGVVNAGFSGLQWCPEVRHAETPEDLIRRLQTVVFSPQALVNAWYILSPPWRQWSTELNNKGIAAEGCEAIESICRELLRLRMRLIPYLYAAYARYRAEGLPPFRALVMDYPGDEKTWKLDDQYMMGDRLLVAPLTAGMKERNVYLPAGDWHDFWSGERHAGGRTITVAPPLEQIPVFVKDGALLPLADAGSCAEDPAGLRLTVRVYGDGRLPITLVEDDGATNEFERGAQNRVTLTWDAAAGTGRQTRSGTAAVPAYTVNAWERAG